MFSASANLTYLFSLCAVFFLELQLCLWSADNKTTSANDNPVNKTIYDPCPVGFKLPASNAFTGFTTTGESVSSSTQVNGTWSSSEKGWYIIGTPQVVIGIISIISIVHQIRIENTVLDTIIPVKIRSTLRTEWVTQPKSGMTRREFHLQQIL